MICRVEVTFIKANGEKIKAKGKVGDSLLDVVVNNNIDLDGFGACEGTLTCSTCHLIFKKEDYDQLPDKPTDEELDMLDLAYDLTDTSRLGCQIILSEKLNGLEVRVPATINDARDNWLWNDVSGCIADMIRKLDNFAHVLSMYVAAILCVNNFYADT